LLYKIILLFTSNVSTHKMCKHLLYRMYYEHPVLFIINCNTLFPNSCQLKSYGNGSQTVFPCKWDYNGQGFEYQIVAGPVFIVIYTFAGIFISFAADKYNRKVLLASCLMFWSAMTLLTGFIKEYWQLVLLRFGLGFGYKLNCRIYNLSIEAFEMTFGLTIVKGVNMCNHLHTLSFGPIKRLNHMYTAVYVHMQHVIQRLSEHQMSFRAFC